MKDECTPPSLPEKQTGLRNRTAAYGRRGSAWRQNVVEDQVPLARLMTRLSGYCFDTEAFSGNMLDWTCGKTDVHQVSRVLKFGSSDVVILGPDLNQRVVTKYGDAASGLTITIARPENYKTGLEGTGPLSTETENNKAYQLCSENCEVLLFPAPEGEYVWDFTQNMTQTRFMLVLKDPEYIPAQIMTEEGLLVVGVDFEIGHGFLIFKEDPRDLFSDFLIYCKGGNETRNHYLSYLVSADGMFTRGDHVVNYLRNSQSAKALELAAAEYAGVAIAPWDAEIIKVVPKCGVILYVTEKGIIEARHPHTPLEQGYMLTAGEIIGGGLRLISKADSYGGGEWHRQVNWSSGILLDRLTPFKNIIIPDAPGKAIAYEASTTHDNFHVKITLDGETDAFWERIKRVEQLSGRYLNDAFGFTSLGEDANVNPLDFYFKYLFSNRGVVVLMNPASLGELAVSRIIEFINKYKPVGSIFFHEHESPNIDVGAFVYSGYWLAISDTEVLAPWDDAVFYAEE